MGRNRQVRAPARRLPHRLPTQPQLRSRRQPAVAPALVRKVRPREAADALLTQLVLECPDEGCGIALDPSRAPSGGVSTSTLVIFDLRFPILGCTARSTDRADFAVS